MQNFWGSYPFFWCSPHPSPLPFGLPVWSPEEGLQTKRTCFVIFSQGQNWGSPACRFHRLFFWPFLKTVATRAFLSSFLWICVPRDCGQPQGLLPCPKHTGPFPAPAVSPACFTHCRAGLQSEAECSKACLPRPVARGGRDAEEECASLLYWDGQVARQWWATCSVEHLAKTVWNQCSCLN